MEEEIESLDKNRTWILEYRSGNKRLAESKWTYKRKEGILGVEQCRWKARLVAKKFTQEKKAYKF